MSGAKRRGRRSSVYTIDGTVVLNALKAKIKSAESDDNPGGESFGCFFQSEEVFVKNKIRKFRRVYMADHNYKVGWVVDSDIPFCMICLTTFGWFGLKHHCRACGLLVCTYCSPYQAQVPNLYEDLGSRVCKNCFYLNKSSEEDGECDGSFPQRLSSPVREASIGNRMIVSRTELSLDSMEAEAIERAMIPVYEDAYITMRQLIPVNIFYLTYENLLEHGVPQSIANRLWHTKILWLIVMHPDDIAKVHLADFRTKYSNLDTLDIVEMRAIWFNLPGWTEEGEDDEDRDNNSSGPNTPNGGSISPYRTNEQILVRAKNKWRDIFKSRLDALTEKEGRNALSVNYIRNEAYMEFQGLKIFDPDVPLIPWEDDTENGLYSPKLGGAHRENYDHLYDNHLVSGHITHHLEPNEVKNEQFMLRYHNGNRDNQNLYIDAFQDEDYGQEYAQEYDRDGDGEEYSQSQQSPYTAEEDAAMFEEQLQGVEGGDLDGESALSADQRDYLSDRTHELNENTNRILNQYYRQQYAKQQLRLSKQKESEQQQQNKAVVTDNTKQKTPSPVTSTNSSSKSNSKKATSSSGGSTGVRSKPSSPVPNRAGGDILQEPVEK